MNWRLQNNPTGYRENMYTLKDFRIMGISTSKGFRGKYIYTFNELASKIPKGFKERYTQVWPRSKYHRPCMGQPQLWPDLRVLLDHWGSAHHVKVFEHGILNIRESADFTLLIIGNPGLLYRFLTTSLGCYSLRRSCNLSVIRPTTRRRVIKVCSRHWASEQHSVGVDNV